MANNTFDYAALGARLRVLRQTANMTQEELAEATNVSTSFIGHIERGEKKFSVATLNALVNALGTSADFLMQGTTPASAADGTLKEAVQAVLDSFK